MKQEFETTYGLIGLFLISSLNVAYAIDPPPDDAKPPAAVEKQDTVGQEPEDKTVAFAGLATATLPDMVADHLDIGSRTGVIVRTIYPEGPAEKAGLSINDIILSVDQTPVGNPEALSSLIRERKVGDELRFEIIHKGKATTVKLTLGERPAGLIAQIGQEPLLDGVPELHLERLRGLLDQNMEGFGPNPNLGMMFPDGQFQDALRMMRERMNKGLEAEPLENEKPGNGIRFQQSSTIRMMDGQGSVEIKSIGKNTEVTVRDKNNEIVWEGPWDTEQDKAAAPEDIRERIDRVNLGAGKGFGIRFRNQLPAPQPDEIDN